MHIQSFHISQEGEKIAEASGLINNINDEDQHSIDLSTYDTGLNDENRWPELVRAIKEELTVTDLAFDLQDKKKLDQILNALLRGPDKSSPHWGIEGNNSDNMLGLPAIIRRVRSHPLNDSLVLSGAKGAAILKKYPEILSSLKENYSRSLLACSAFVGAYVSQEQNSIPVFRQTGDDGPSQEICFPASFHGDFRIGYREVYEEGSLTPVGDKVPFAPKPEVEQFAAYHSVEPEILFSVMRYLISLEVSNEEQVRLYCKIIEQTKNAAYGGNFGDFGDDELREYLYRIKDIKDYTTPKISLSDKGDEYTLMESIVTPGNYDSLFSIVVQDNTFIIRNFNTKDPTATHDLEIQHENMVDFVSTMINTPGGRTAPQTLIKMIEARLDNLRNYT